MAPDVISTSAWGPKPDCEVCGAGSVTSFNWKLASTENSLHRAKDLSHFHFDRDLRWGTLFHCSRCSHPWYLDGNRSFMNSVPRDRLVLIEKWNEQPIHLTDAFLETLNNIGSTLPNYVVNGSKCVETPCGVVTLSGERIDLAIVSRQKHPPHENWRNCRLASQISEIYPSPHTLPLTVRLATTQSMEWRMGFWPEMVGDDQGRIVVLNGIQDFLVKDGWDARTVRLLHPWPKDALNCEIYSETTGVTYFVADP